MKIAIIGAGASGMTAALQAAWNGGTVTLFERNVSVGRKLLVTGSGRCNLTNDAVGAASYVCGDTAWMEALLKGFGVPELLTMLASIGIPAWKTSDGWYYPLSNSSQSVVEAFASALKQAGVILSCQAQVTSLRISGKDMLVQWINEDKEREGSFDRVILSAGGKAYPSLGSRGELFPVLERLGHTVLSKRPALAPVLADLGNWRSLQGMRLDVGATLWNGSRKLGFSKGNLIFTEWGLNGPAVMDLSHLVSAHSSGGLELSLDLLAFIQAEFDQLLLQHRQNPIPLRVFLGAFFPPKVVLALLKNARLPEEILMHQMDERALQTLVSRLKDLRIPVKGVRDFEYCQVSAGGVPVSEVDPQTLESYRVKGLFLTGETLDVVGPCGGFNLQYAFSSGALAGRAAARKD